MRASRTRPEVPLGLLLLSALAPGIAQAQLLSPGRLARPHGALEGLSNCTRCHEAGAGVSSEKCLACHEEVARRVTENRGFHGRIARQDRACARCHLDHQGLDFPLIDFGPGGRERFDHAATGFRLEGAHAERPCADCHEERRILDPAIRALRARAPSRSTHLGLGNRCPDCHFDEHRGQLSAECEACHDSVRMVPAPKFSHARTDYPLTGAHERAPCAGCHPDEVDATTRVDAFPAHKARIFARYRPVAYGECSSCHADPHESRFGPMCGGCHTTESWRSRVRGFEPESRVAFHERTQFPLRGAHASTPCDTCHRPSPSEPARFRGLPFDRCDRCHPDGHAAQLGSNRDCDGCHQEDTFGRASFDLAEHDATPFPLGGAHRAVACGRCHAQKAPPPATAQPSPKRSTIARARASLALFTRAEPLDRCESCHADPHRGQFLSSPREKRCAACHSEPSFRALRFDHDRDSTFPLIDRHADVSCAGCHERGPGDVVQYRGTPRACAACHLDIHAGQFDLRAPATARGPRSSAPDCARCHDARSFRPARVEHAAASGANYPLEGRHAQISCAGCHPPVALADATSLVRYRPVPRFCDACHVDVHAGAVTRFGGCTTCHGTQSWAASGFDHQATRFPLEGRHREASCVACHADPKVLAAGTACGRCHEDVHAGTFGATCTACHGFERWDSDFDALAHRRTNSPLQGRHAALPCEECHADVGDRRFARAFVRCEGCHISDYLGARLRSVDHVASGFGTDCQRCHGLSTFSPARLPDHEVCFPIAAGAHARMGCLECHSSLASTALTGSCRSGSARCASCHAHDCARSDTIHADVPGYQCKDRKCYECHSFQRSG